MNEQDMDKIIDAAFRIVGAGMARTMRSALDKLPDALWPNLTWEERTRRSIALRQRFEAVKYQYPLFTWQW